MIKIPYWKYSEKYWKFSERVMTYDFSFLDSERKEKILFWRTRYSLDIMECVPNTKINEHLKAT